jgi:hypothetical protein
VLPNSDAVAAQTTIASDRTTSAEPPADLGWPRIFSSNGQAFTVYQPQLDSWDGFTLNAHAAVALAAGADDAPLFGVASIKVRTLVDKSARLASVEDLQVTEARFPSAPAQEQAYAQALREALPGNIRSVSLDRLGAQSAIQQAQSASEALPLQNTPPRIVFMQQPAVLAYIDGEPQHVAVEGAKLMRVVNTRVLLLKDPAGKLYLHPLDGYMEAAALTGPWSVAKWPPREAGKAETVVGDQFEPPILRAKVPSDPAITNAAFQSRRRNAQLRQPLLVPSRDVPSRFTDLR